MAYTPFTIKNLSDTYPADIRSITYVDQSGIVHHSDFSNFGGAFAGDTNNLNGSTVRTHDKTYVTGSPLQKTFDTDTTAVDNRVANYSGTLLIVSDAMPLVKAGWLSNSSDTKYNGLHIVSISGTTSTWLTMSGTPSGTPTIGGTVTFSTTTNEINLQSPSTTTGIGPGWTITGNGYTSPGTVISVKDSNTIIVNTLPINAQQGNPLIFTSSTNFLTLNNTNDIEVDWAASGNGYDGSQYILSKNGDTVIMSAPPNGNPSSGGTITFSSVRIPIYTIGTSSSVAFSIDYTNSTSVLGTYASQVTINAIQNGPVVLLVNNFVGINATPVSNVYTPTTPGGGGGGRGGGGGYSGGGSTTSGNGVGAATPHGADGGMNGGGGATSASGGPAGQGGGECFLPDAKITMANGSIKDFRDLKVGDIVVGAFGELNPVLALYYSKMGNIPMYKINNDHDCTDDEVFVTTDKKFYCIDPTPGTTGVLAGWKEAYEMDLGNGMSDVWVSPWAVGQVDIELNKATPGIEIQTINGGRKLETFEPYYLPPETHLYNCVVGGSHTIMINGYAHTAWVRDDDFDYTAWKPIDIKLTIDDYRNPKKSRIGN